MNLLINRKGNTLVVTLLFLIVISIISFGLINSVVLEVKRKQSDLKYIDMKIELQNLTYDYLAVSVGKTLSEYETLLNNVDVDDINIDYELKDNIITIFINKSTYNNSQKCCAELLIMDSKINGYKILKWGIEYHSYTEE